MFGTVSGEAESCALSVSLAWHWCDLLGAPFCGGGVADVLGEFPALSFGVGDDGLAQSPGLVSGAVENGPACGGDAGTCGVDVVDEDEGDGGGFAEPASCQAEHEDGGVADEFDVPDRAAVGNGEPDGLAKAEDFGDPPGSGRGIAVEQVGHCSRVASCRVVHEMPPAGSVGVGGDIDDVAVGVADEEPPDAPGFGGEWVDDVVAEALRQRVRRIDVVDVDRQHKSSRAVASPLTRLTWAAGLPSC